ncbi:MAG TPA: hypothetical protein VK743_11970 [Steroidobacteraceae bacterium]|jgi:hypothetical protein|nr:hypothetical protein [Steroidobacteraceae bacterium]
MRYSLYSLQLLESTNRNARDMQRRTRMWCELGVLGAVIAGIVFVGSRPMTVSLPKIDATGPSAHWMDAIATVAATSIVALILIAILGLMIWLVRSIIRRGAKGDAPL